MVTRGNTRTRVVIVVEDDQPIGELLAGVINDEDGYRAFHVTRSTEALQALEQVKPDLLVLDVGLPGMSGLELYDRLQKDERTRGVPQARDPQRPAEAVRPERADRKREGAGPARRGLARGAILGVFAFLRDA